MSVFLTQFGVSSDDPLNAAFTIATIAAIIFFVVGEYTQNVSYVDRSWPIIPVLFASYFVIASPWLDPRMVLILTLKVVWAGKILNQAFKRGYYDFSMEDHRYSYVRQRLPRWAFTLLNLFFVSFAELYLLLFTELPLIYLSRKNSLLKGSLMPLNAGDAFVALLFLVNLYVEDTADNQQQAFQRLKYSSPTPTEANTVTKSRKQALQLGFTTNGLFAWSRHPNFLCEIAGWYILYLFTVVPFISWDDVIHARIFNYSALSPLLMNTLFLASTHLTEKITAEKYLSYRQYQRRVGKFLPTSTIIKGFLLTSQEKHQVELTLWPKKSKSN